MIDLLQIVGLVASVASMIGFLPQVIKTFRTKSAKDLSIWMVLVFMIASFSWTIYGFWKNDIFIIMTNVIIFFLDLTLFAMVLKFKK